MAAGGGLSGGGMRTVFLGGLDFPEILALRVPAPTMVLNCRQDPLHTMREMERVLGRAAATAPSTTAAATSSTAFSNPPPLHAEAPDYSMLILSIASSIRKA